MLNEIVRELNTQIEDFLNTLDNIGSNFRFVFLGTFYIVVIFMIISRTTNIILKPNELQHYTFNYQLHRYIGEGLMMMFVIWVFYIAYLGIREHLKQEGLI